MADEFEEFFSEGTQWVNGTGTPAPEPAPETAQSRRELRRRRERRRRNGMMKIVAVVATVAIVAVGAVFAYRAILSWREARLSGGVSDVQDYAGPGSGEAVFTVESGQGAQEIGENLVDAGIVKSVGAFTSAVTAADATLYPGTYTLKLQMRSVDVVKILSDPSQAGGFLEVRPGERLSDVIAAAVQVSGLAEDEFTAITSGGGSGILPAEAGGSFEGWLEPGTYDVQNRTAEEILRQMVDARIAKLDELGAPSGDERERILKIASIAEAEVNRDDYYGKVARVIENRLTQGMNLGMDTSLAYGLGTTAAKITDADIADASNPYNLHQNPGLPPTPISNPGDSAIKAAISPEEGDWMYFVTVDLETGETKFVATEDEFWQIRDEYKNNNENAN
ncbi:endolytic transglycosylase MltG [Bifidobacterium samirii]|uniref:Endolytic murein transglycosylase n=1 Tax=Bifidobacterium samirii TaxID=2306974 RepID=A0A430FU24_9BIFI|nr:endolytic transglycosylase MltG [Bifidobacterium samirii]RSX56565.1 YceG-like family [Bifidobacterium samirii]